MLQNLGWQSLDSRSHAGSTLSPIYKIINGLASVETEDTSRQMTPVKGRITASNSNTYWQIVIHDIA